MTVVFCIAMVFCAYTYLVFPLVLHMLAVRADRRASLSASLTPCASAEGASGALPTVSIVIAAHNEARNLPRKIASLDQLDYPEHLLECIFISDGSTDATVSILQCACDSRPHWQLHDYAQAAGKPTALNMGVSIATGHIIVFMDARQTVAAESVRALVSRLEDADVGAVSGELVLADDHGREAPSVGLYWQYEKWIRENESRLFSTTGATGALYAIRRTDYQPLVHDVLLDDFDTPIALLRRGKRTVLEPRARLFDQAEADSAREFRRKVRTLAGNFQSFSRHKWLFHPRRNPVWWQFLSHKVFRLLIPYALGIALLASILGQGAFLHSMLYVQLGFYALGLMGMLGVNNRVVSFIKLFLQLNAAAVVGAWRAVLGRTSVRWKSS